MQFVFRFLVGMIASQVASFHNPHSIFLKPIPVCRTMR